MALMALMALIVALDSAPVAEAIEGLALDPLQGDIVAAEVAAFATALPAPLTADAAESRTRLAALAAAAAEGEVAAELVPGLEEVLDLSLSTGRARRFHGAEGEAALLRLFRQTPKGAALGRTVEAANRALSGLRGQAIEAITFSPRTPGALRLEIATDTCRVVLEIDRAGVTVDSVEV